jgi:beta-lactam-binding protein with PASTA domain
VRFTRDGQIDPSFGLKGVALLPSSGSTSLDLEADGKVLVGGGVDGSTLVRVVGGNNCVVPGLRGQTLANARAALRTSYCGLGTVAKLYSNKVAAGLVISTTPLRGGRLPRGTKVALAVSRGRRG